MVSVGVAGPAWLAAGWGPHGLWGSPGQRSGGATLAHGFFRRSRDGMHTSRPHVNTCNIFIHTHILKSSKARIELGCRVRHAVGSVTCRHPPGASSSHSKA